MGCGCSKKKPYFKTIETPKIKVSCPNCTDGLVGIDGRFYPVNLTIVEVTETQFEIWSEDGYPVEKVV